MSGKFSNLGPPGLARRFAKGGDAHAQHKAAAHKTKPDVSPSKPASGDKSEDRIEKWRKANKALYLERQREYQRAYRKRKKK